jgi:hypothetical protein
MNKRMRVVPLFLAVLFIIFGVAGCMGRDKYTDGQEDKIVELGKSLLEEYLASLPSKNVEAENYFMTEAAEEGSLIYGGRYPANAVTVCFNADGGKYKAIVDLETGTIYSNYYIFDLNEHIREQLKPYCERYGFSGEYIIQGAKVCITIHSHDVAVKGKSNKTVDSYIDIEDMIPAEFNQTDENERAEAFLMKAPISGFNIEFTIQGDEFFDPRILTDYLAESGNYQNERTPNRAWNSYEIYGKKRFDKFPEDGVCTWETYLDFEGDIKTMPYYMRRTDFYKEREFCFNYTAAIKRGNINKYETDELKECSFPIEIKEGKLSYHVYEGSEGATLMFEEKPKYTFTRTCYEIDYKRNIIKEKEKENLILMQNSDGMWYLTPEDSQNTYMYSYIFDKEQDLQFR